MSGCRSVARWEPAAWPVRWGESIASPWGTWTGKSKHTSTGGPPRLAHGSRRERAAATLLGVYYDLGRPGVHMPPPPRIRGPGEAGRGGAGEGRQHSDQQAPFVLPSIAIYQRQTRAAFHGFHFSCPGGGGLQTQWGMRPRNFPPIRGSGCGPTEWGKVPNRAVESPSLGCCHCPGGEGGGHQESCCGDPGPSGWKETLGQDSVVG